MSLSRRSVVLVGLIPLFLLGGCGYSGGSGSGLPSTSPTTLSPTGEVLLQVGSATYQVGDTIRVRILNQSKRAISFPDHQTNCSVLLLEHQTDSSWKPVAPCKLMIATRLYKMQAGATLDVALTPSLAWPVGTYRARLDYTLVNESTNTPRSAYSRGFVWADGNPRA